MEKLIEYILFIYIGINQNSWTTIPIESITFVLKSLDNMGSVF